MSDDGIGPVELTGRWVGFYRHRWEQMGTFPIVAELRQTGANISGEMFDQITDRSESLDRVYEMVRNDTTPENRRFMEKVISHFGSETVVRNSKLPDTSDISGTIKGTLVKFSKTYRGAHTINLVAKGREVGRAQRSTHIVHYSGEFNPESACISGKWIIKKPGLFGWLSSPQGWGPFELYKKS